MKTLTNVRVKPNKIIVYNPYCYTNLWEVLSYRMSKQITQIRIYPTNNDYYSVCPSCYHSIEREYMSYCNNCGQKLRWDVYSLFNVKTIIHNHKTHIKTVILSNKQNVVKKRLQKQIYNL